MKTAWGRINSLLRPSRVKPKLKLKVNDTLITDSTELASILKNLFSSVAQVLDANIPSLPDDPTSNERKIRNSLAFINNHSGENYNIMLPLNPRVPHR